MDGTFLVQGYAAVEISCCAEKVETASLPIVALVGLVYVRLGEYEDLGADRVPLDLRPLSLEESLLTGGWRR